MGLGFPGMSEGSCGRPGDGRSIYNVGRRGGWVPPIRKEETELRPHKSVYVSTTASKGQKGGSVCLSVEEAGTAGRTERGKGGVAGGTLDLPQTIWRMGNSTMVKALGG